MYACMYVFIYVRTYVCTYVRVCMYVCMYVYMYVRTRVSKNDCVYSYTCTIFVLTCRWLHAPSQALLSTGRLCVAVGDHLVGRVDELVAIVRDSLQVLKGTSSVCLSLSASHSQLIQSMQSTVTTSTSSKVLFINRFYQHSQSLLSWPKWSTLFLAYPVSGCVPRHPIRLRHGVTISLYSIIPLFYYFLPRLILRLLGCAEWRSEQERHQGEVGGPLRAHRGRRCLRDAAVHSGHGAGIRLRGYISLVQTGYSRLIYLFISKHSPHKISQCNPLPCTALHSLHYTAYYTAYCTAYCTHCAVGFGRPLSRARAVAGGSDVPARTHPRAHRHAGCACEVRV